MKAFLEEYGLIIVVVAVIMVMLLLGTTVGADAKDNIVATVANFLTVAEQVEPELDNPGGEEQQEEVVVLPSVTYTETKISEEYVGGKWNDTINYYKNTYTLNNFQGVSNVRLVYGFYNSHGYAADKGINLFNALDNDLIVKLITENSSYVSTTIKNVESNGVYELTADNNFYKNTYYNVGTCAIVDYILYDVVEDGEIVTKYIIIM